MEASVKLNSNVVPRGDSWDMGIDPKLRCHSLIILMTGAHTMIFSHLFLRQNMKRISLADLRYLGIVVSH